MSDLFVSYARADEEAAARVADSLRAEGYRVWRDDELPAHRSYADVIEERLKAAKAVIVLWSADAVKSQWVRAEADSARSAGTLVQAAIDGTVPPMPFNQIQCADLNGWDCTDGSPGWRKLKASITALAGAAPPANEGKPRANRRQLCICVLPFQNMSGDPEQEYFSDGISEDITTDLSKISALGVVARNTAFTFKGQSIDVADVARKLGVSHVLEGSVRKAGGRVRINAQLIDGGSGEHLWAERYDRELEDIFTIQDEISKAIVEALKIKLLPEEKKALEQRGTTSAEAYNLYLLARQYWVTGNHGDPRREERVMRICSRAVEIDPYYAQAWALLALAQASLHHGYQSDVDDGFAAAHTALSIDPMIAEAHLPLVRRLEKKHLFDAAEEALSKALALAPDSWEVNKEAGRFCMLRRNVDQAIVHYEKAVEVMETDFHAWAILVTCYGSKNDKPNIRRSAKMMVSEAHKALEQDPSNGAALGIIAGGHAILGEAERARESIDRAMLIDPDNLNMRYNFACVLARHLDDREEALKLVDRCLTSGGELLLRHAESDPDLDSLRNDPRFTAMLAHARSRLGLKNEPAREAIAATQLGSRSSE